MPTHFLMHNKTDQVGVVVVEDVQPGQPLSGWLLETDETIEVKARDAIPLGHKVAFAEIKEGDTVIEYGHDIGRASAAIGRGEHVHVHNIKTKRW